MNINFVATNHVGQPGTITMPIGYDLSGYTLSVDICPDMSFSSVTHQGTVSLSGHTVSLSFTAAEVDAIQNCYFRIQATGTRTFYVYGGQILYAPVGGIVISDSSIDGTGYLGPAANLSVQQAIDSLGTWQDTPNAVVRRDGGGNATMNTVALDSNPSQPYHATRKDYVDALGTPSSTPDTIVRRDAGGNFLGNAIYVDAGNGPADPGNKLTRKDYVDRITKADGLSVADIDTATEPGHAYWLNASTLIPNSGNCLLEVFSGASGGVIIQRLTGWDSGMVATRRLWTGTWTGWTVLATMAYVDAGDHREFLHATVGDGSGTISFSIGSAFTTVPLSVVDYDTAGGFNTSTGIYTVAVAGYYDVNATMRVDGTAANIQVGMGVGTQNTDSPTFVWSATSGALRNTFAYARNAHFNAGDQVRLFAYVDGSSTGFAAASLSLSLIGR